MGASGKLTILELLSLTLSVKDDGDDEAIDTEDTRHDNGYNGLEDEVSPQHTHAADANT